MGDMERFPKPRHFSIQTKHDHVQHGDLFETDASLQRDY